MERRSTKHARDPAQGFAKLRRNSTSDRLEQSEEVKTSLLSFLKETLNSANSTKELEQKGRRHWGENVIRPTCMQQLEESPPSKDRPDLLLPPTVEEQPSQRSEQDSSLLPVQNSFYQSKES